MDRFDAIVLGTGGVGSAALMHLARRGVRVLGLDRFPPGHDRGSSHGQSRLIRQAYFEHPDYVPLVKRSYTLWHELEQAAGETLYHQVGLIEFGPPNGRVIRGAQASAARHNLTIEKLAPAECERRFPGYRVPDGFAAVFEACAGYLLVERCVRAQAGEAVRAGATLRSDEAVRHWRADGTGVVVETDRGRYAAAALAIAAGAWSGSLLAELGISFEVRRKPLFWFATRDDTYAAAGGCPAFFYELEHGCFYGFPQIDDLGVKVAEHTGGRVVADPLAVDREVDAGEERRMAAFVAEHLPAATSRRTGHAVCMYTMTPDEHFIVDRHPRYSQVAFAAGLSGHGFKFAPVLGEALADLALGGETALPIGFLSLGRESLRGVC